MSSWHLGGAWVRNVGLGWVRVRMRQRDESLWDGPVPKGDEKVSTTGCHWPYQSLIRLGYPMALDP